MVRVIQRTLDRFRLPFGREAKLRRRLRMAPPLLVYQMGKVGSSSLRFSLAPVWPGLTIQTHNIARDRDRSAKLRLVYDHVIQSGGPVFIICPVREPVGRNISAFFQKFERHTGVRYRNSNLAIDELITIFLHNLNHDSALTWFDEQLKPFFGIDVYNYAFPEAGFQMIQRQNTHLLLMRSELPDRIKEAAVREFLRIPKFQLLPANIGLEKEYAATYRQFVETFIAPDWYLDRMYNCRFFRHFYDESYKEMFVQKWTKTSTVDLASR